MEPSQRRSVAVLYNTDFRSLPAADDHASRADVENAAHGVARALAARGHLVTVHGVDAGDLLATLRELAAAPPDIVFNLCESLAGDARHEAVVPSLCDLHGLLYTGSGPVALGLALRKDLTKALLRARGVPTPEAVCVDSVEAAGDAAAHLGFPLIVKPSREDASIGIHATSVCSDERALAVAVGRVLDEHRQPALVERFVDGREIYVSLLGNAPTRALPFHEIDFADLPGGVPRIVSYAAKWDPASPEFHGTRPVRCDLDETTRERVERVARAAFAALELRDYARVDVRLDAQHVPHVIDVNPNCDLSDGAGFSRAAGFAGLDYLSLVDAVVVAAWERASDVQRDRSVTRPRATVETPRRRARAAAALAGAGHPRAAAGGSGGAR